MPSTTQINNEPYRVGYADHNLLFLASAAGMDGDFQAASRAAEQLRDDAPTSQQSFHSEIYSNLLRFGQWRAVLALPSPDPDEKGVTFFWRFARASALAALGDPERATTERAAMVQLYRVMPYGLSFGLPPTPWPALHDLAFDCMDVRLASARGDAAAAIAKWRSRFGMVSKPSG